jgi:hypothetical protein
VCLDSEGRSIFNELLLGRGCPIFYAFDLLYLNDRDLRQLPLIQRKEKLRRLLEKSRLTAVMCGKYVEQRGVDLFNEVCQRNLESVVAKRKSGTYATVGGWLRIKNPNYTQSDQRHELFESFKSRNLVPIPRKPPVRSASIRVGPQARKRRSSNAIATPVGYLYGVLDCATVSLSTALDTMRSVQKRDSPGASLPANPKRTTKAERESLDGCYATVHPLSCVADPRTRADSNDFHLRRHEYKEANQCERSRQ